MSSVHRQPRRKCWYCAYTDQQGKRHFKSTKTTNKRKAETICAGMQRAADLAKVGVLSHQKARRVIAGVVAEIAELAGEKLRASSVREFFTTWMKEREKTVSESTFRSWEGYLETFLEYLGVRADDDVSGIGIQDVKRYRDTIAERLSTGSVNNHLKWLRLVLHEAQTEEFIDSNPARLVANLRRSDKADRRPFSESEIRALLKLANQDWKTAVLLGLYTGLRLGDISRLTWENLNLTAKELTIATQKTGRIVNLPIAEPLLKHLESLPAGDDPRQPICPELHERPTAQNSNTFYELMTRAKLVPSRRAMAKLEGLPGDRRRTSPISFHSLRHTITTWLKDAGVSDAVCMDIVGHESEAVSRNYTHLPVETKREALRKLPDVTK